jgi:hypothetical protein
VIKLAIILLLVGLTAGGFTLYRNPGAGSAHETVKPGDPISLGLDLLLPSHCELRVVGVSVGLDPEFEPLKIFDSRIFSGKDGSEFTTHETAAGNLEIDNSRGVYLSAEVRKYAQPKAGTSEVWGDLKCTNAVERTLPLLAFVGVLGSIIILVAASIIKLTSITSSTEQGD